MKQTALLLVLLSLSALAAEKLTNADVVMMLQGKVPQDVIIQKIADCEPNFSLAPANLVELVSKGAPDDVVRAMTARQRGSPGSLAQNAKDTPRRNSEREPIRNSAACRGN